MSSRSRNRSGVALVLGAVGLLITACGQPASPAVDRQVPPGGDRMAGVRQVPLRPGMPATTDEPLPNPLGSDPAVVREGERMYRWMNCIGCHFEGGGGMGPPLMDTKWIYGSSPAQIFDSIVNGRPNGMPAFGDKLVADEVWRIVAYVETLAPEGQEGSEPDARRVMSVQRQGGDGQ